MEPVDSSEPNPAEWTDWASTLADSGPPADDGPPQRTLAWVGEQLGAAVVDAEPLVGGLSSAMHRLTLTDGRRVVLRRHTNRSWMEREPNIPFDEARILAMLGDLDVGVATPVLIAADPGAERCDVPAVIMTEVPGRPSLDPIEPRGWAERFAECLVAIHRTPIPQGLSPYRRWDHPDAPVPVWIQDQDQWNRAIALVAGPLPEHEPTFLHRDFHPNNVHWDGDRICGVVDWLGACIGPVAADIAHCRWNLAILVSPDVADRFTEHYRLLTGYQHPTIEFDLATVASAPVGPFPTNAWNDLGRTDLTSATVATRIEAWLDQLLEDADG